jgi:hypothetical protein
MQVFKYIADNNTEDALDYCQQNGYTEIYNTNQLANSLRNIFAKSEEKAKEILGLHPDKNVILEVFEIKPIEVTKIETPKEYVEKRNFDCYKNAEGDSTKVASQTNTYILLGAIIISLAIISIKVK